MSDEDENLLPVKRSREGFGWKNGLNVGIEIGFLLDFIVTGKRFHAVTPIVGESAIDRISHSFIQSFIQS